ncbi:MAG: DUF3298 and DUF4163 domain-containing protein [Bacteroidales bacterium]|nr:DUF3298 and DUF4163 domain-containing protein [Bacteroidales bacterium]
MKRYIFLLALGVMLCAYGTSKTVNQQGKYYHYYGSNDSIDITLDVWRINDTLEGYLNYCLDTAKRYPAPVQLNGYFYNDTLVEFFNAHTNDLLFNGIITDSLTLNGHWQLEQDTIPLNLTEDYTKGSVYFNVHEITSEERLVENTANPKAKIHLMLLSPDTLKGSLYSDTSKDLITGYFWKKNSDTLAPGAILRLIVDDYFKQYTGDNREIYDEEIGNSFNWMKEKQVKVMFNHDSLLSLRYTDYAYTGGAHGLAIQKLITLNARHDNVLKLQQVIDSSDYDTLSMLLEEELREQFKIDSSETLIDFGFFMDTLIIPRNYLATNQGLLFLYNPYEIAPYAFGNIELFIPFWKLHDKIRNESFIRRFLRKES